MPVWGWFSACLAVHVALCPLPKAAPCRQPSAIFGEVWAEGELGPAALRWKLGGKVVATDTLRKVTAIPQRVALLLNPYFGDQPLALEVATGKDSAQSWLALPSPCGFWLQLAAFSWDRHGICVRLVNAGPADTDLVPLRWLVNGVAVGDTTLGPLPVGREIELILPARGHRLLERVLAEPAKPEFKGQVWTPVIVSLMAFPGPRDLEGPERTWNFHLGFVVLAEKPTPR